MNSCTIISASLDPRFRKLTFLTSEQCDELRDILVDKATTNCSSSSLDEPVVKKKKPLLLLLLQAAALAFAAAYERYAFA